jgi:hypothetical protein
MKVTPVFLSLIALVTIAGCSGTPTESDAQQTVQQRIQSQSNGLIKLVSFRKTNGIAQEFGGMRAYHMEYTAEIEFIDDCMWSAGGMMGWQGNFSAKRGQSQSYSANFLDLSQGFRPAKKGERQSISGAFDYVKTENGWRL